MYNILNIIDVIYDYNFTKIIYNLKKQMKYMPKSLTYLILGNHFDDSLNDMPNHITH